MNYIYSCHTDIGRVREVNQDALVIKDFKVGGQKALLAAVCDGVGGLSRGEMASRKSVEMISDWFDFEVLQILGKGREDEVVTNRLRQMMTGVNEEILRQGNACHSPQGTTLTLLLLWNYRYFIGHVGDSRIYEVSDHVARLTRDHTWVEQEVELGHMTRREASLDLRQNIVLQCVGADERLDPDVACGRVPAPASYVVCSDGFWHDTPESELMRCFSPAAPASQAVMQENLYRMVEQAKQRGENDNITAIVVRVF